MRWRPAPLLPDGLIYLSAVALYEAGQAKMPRPGWAMVGLILGCLVTLAMNVAAGWPHGRGGAAVAALPPVVLFLALEILTGVLRRGRGGGPPGSEAAASPVSCDHRPALSLDEAIQAAAPYMSQRDLAEAFGVGKTTVGRKLKASPEVVPIDAAGGVSPNPPAPLAASNGSHRGA